MRKNLMNLTKADDEKIAENFNGGEHPFYHQDLEEMNLKDAKDWLDKGEMVGIVSEVHGGIIGYVHNEHADDINTVLNLHAIERMKQK